MKKFVLLVLPVVLIAGFLWSHGDAQIVLENHYLVYNVPEMYPFDANIALADQFGLSCVYHAELELFANPVEKNGEPMFDPMMHQTWWRIDDPSSVWWTTIQNQFGEQIWQVKDGRYLVLPALKDIPGLPPPYNHYKCYDAIGDPIHMPVQLVDQFGVYDMIATEVVLFCNPVEKCVEGGET